MNEGKLFFFERDWGGWVGVCFQRLRDFFMSSELLAIIKNDGMNRNGESSTIQ